MPPRIPRLSPWTAFALLASLACNVFFYRWRPVSPATLVYDTRASLLPVLLSPFLVPTPPSALARLVQLAWLIFRTPTRRTSPIYLAGVYVSLLITRCVSGFVLSRSVGWAYPQLFSHRALYEPIFGLGPLLVGTILFDDLRSTRNAVQRLALLGASAALDGAPWTYTEAALIAGAFRLAQRISQENSPALPSWSSTSIFADEKDSAQALPLTPKCILTLALLSTVTCGICGNLPRFVHVGPYTHLGSDATALGAQATPDLHIVMLTVPRTRNLSSDVMIESIASYVAPWLDSLSTQSANNRDSKSNTTLTVFAHAGADGTHPAFERAKTHFASTNLPIRFYMQPPNRDTPEVVSNHYTHLADAAAYAYAHGDEWTMFVEDDFALCGAWGWDNLGRVVSRLEGFDEEKERMNGAFVGTGGSGLIFHRILLPPLRSLLLHTSTLSPLTSPPPPDVLLQTCLAAGPSSCTPPSPSPALSSFSSLANPPAVNPNPWLPAAPTWVISSRLLMGHRGWDLSTGGRTYERGKWACGWRQPMHGVRGVEVVEV
ncbi:hypothetical protein EIP86_007261 [Pleurotus ostreatoroseus]|nr:hypothetical protein EIP86_007261 [Pleurotus ostreatoroseus]